MELKQKTFTVDEANSDEESLFVDVAGRGTVMVTKDGDGLGVNVYPFQVADAPVASISVTNAELWADPNEPQQETN